MDDTDKAVKRTGPAKGTPRLSQDPRRMLRRRLAAGLAQVTAARSAGCTKGNLSKLEHGVHSASPELLTALAALYGCGIADLIPARHKNLLARFAQEADPDGRLPGTERDIRALNLLAEYFQNGEPEADGAAA